MTSVLLSLPLFWMGVLCICPGAGMETVPMELRVVRAQEDWREAWEQLGSLRQGDLNAAEQAELHSKLDARLESDGNAGPPSPRAIILGELLARLDGAPTQSIPASDLGLAAPDFLGDLQGQEHWLAAKVLGPGPAQVAQILLGLGPNAGVEASVLTNANINLAWTVGVDAARAGRHADGALPIQLRLHWLYPASWSATDLALTLGLLGRRQEADAVLAAEITRELALEDGLGRVDPELWNRRALIALGVRHERQARNYLGKAIRLGSINSAVVLARLDLERGDLAGARRGFRALSWDPDPGAWTQRGYGLALLPPRPTQSRTAATDSHRSAR